MDIPRSRAVPMTVEEWRLLPFEPGWKCEYWDGKAHYSPRCHAVVTTIAVAPLDVNTDCLFRQPAESDIEPLTTVYAAAFRETIEYFGKSQEQVAEAARRDLTNYFAGKHGQPTSASCLAIAPGSNPDEETFAGAAIVTSTENGPLLYLLFVAPQWQRRGLATAMVSAAINELYELGEKTLTSRYHIGNEQSLAWHQRFGFVEEPDLRRARLYLQQSKVELWRRERIGGLTAEERAKLIADVARWSAEVEKLERIEDQHGFEAVHPMTRW
ncbi:MAG TPA: GNAT family N-acetyltransferase [Blastocatellia bacterium]|nr:GNAT family N-acetyltransferase [Blastocatellia bacterium]